MAILATKQKSKILKKCLSCQCDKSIDDYYVSNNKLHADGLIPWCIDCVKKMSVKESGEVNEEKFEEILRQIDRPFYKDVLASSEGEHVKRTSNVPPAAIKFYGGDIIGLYFKNINMVQNKGKTYSDSIKSGFYRNPENASIAKNGKRVNLKNDDVTNSEYTDVDAATTIKEEFEATSEMIDLFGDGYTPSEYKKMEKKYRDMKQAYSIQTNLHQEALITYVRFKVKEEIATAKGDVQEAQKWYQAAQDAADKAKLTPKQLTKADLQGGINSFSEIFKAVEQAVDVIPILPKFVYRPNDALDFNIWCYINYARDLQGLPQCSYKDVYEFYDKKKQEYLEQYGDPYGIFDDEPTEKNRENVKKFITLPKDYEDGDE